MTHILVLTAGKSPEPLINCINNVNPDRVVFICSEGSADSIDKVVNNVALADFERERDVVTLQQRLKRNDGIEVYNSLDRLDHVYHQTQELLKRIQDENPGSRITADYTGGTKTMAAGLAMAAIDNENIELFVTTAEQRNSGESNITGHSIPVPIVQGSIHTHRLLSAELPLLLKRYDYAAARGAVSRVRLLKSHSDVTASELRVLDSILEAFDAWDRFDHVKALSILENKASDPILRPYVFNLKRIIGSRKLLDQNEQIQAAKFINGHGLEIIKDLLLNAERRAEQKRYDDAVGRLYRAIELTAQIQLICDHGLHTGNIEIAKLPLHLQPSYLEIHQRQGVNSSLKLGLVASYDLLFDLENPLGLHWKRERNSILGQLQHRNNSLFAHGFQPIQVNSWNEIKFTIGGFLNAVISEKSSAQQDRQLQFPRNLESLGM
jgi:CRISPR-associated protein (TIGR02710 family)